MGHVLCDFVGEQGTEPLVPASLLGGELEDRVAGKRPTFLLLVATLLPGSSEASPALITTH